MAASPEHNPLIPSTMLKAFIIPTAQKIVKAGQKSPIYMFPKNNRLPILTKYIFDKTINKPQAAI